MCSHNQISVFFIQSWIPSKLLSSKIINKSNFLKIEIIHNLIKTELSCKYENLANLHTFLTLGLGVGVGREINFCLPQNYKEQKIVT